MGGPWREPGFDVERVRVSPRSRPWARRAERVAEHEGLSRLVLAYVAAVAVAIGIMVGLMQRGW